MPTLVWLYLTAILYYRTSATCVALAEALQTVSHDRLTRMLQADWSGQRLLESAFRTLFVWERGYRIIDDTVVPDELMFSQPPHVAGTETEARGRSRAAENFPSVAEWVSSGRTVSLTLEKAIEIYYPRSRSASHTGRFPGRAAAAGSTCNIPRPLARSTSGNHEPS